MGAITAGDLTLLRQPVDTQTSLERLYLFGFPNIWTGRVNEAPARGDRTITYDGGVMAGSFIFADLTNYGAGLEVWFGSAAGLKDIGVRRLRSMGAAAAAGNMVIDWNDDMDLADDDFITIKHVYSPWPKYSYFTAAGPVFYKDGPDGTIYAASGDANETPAPHVIMGRNYAGELTGASLDISFDATNSVDVAGGGGGVTYAWKVTPNDGNALFVDTGTSTSALAAPTLRATAEGEWWVHCTVTINARSTLAHRAVIVGGGITEFTRSPITSQWDSTDINVTLSLTSPETGVDIRGVMTWADVQDHTLTIITAEDWYGATNKSISFRDDDVYDDRQHIVFCGYLTLENMDLMDDGTGVVELQAVSLLDMFLYSLSLTGMTAVDQWYEMINTQMTVAGNLLHLFRWHSTLLDIADWWLPWSDTVRRSANEEFSEGNMLERGRALCRARLMGMTANPQGEIFVETDLNLRTQAQRAAETTTMILTEADIAGTKRARTRRRGDTVRVLVDGGYSTGVMGSYQPFFAASQNVAKAETRPALVHVDRLMFPNQAEANRVAARLQAVANRHYIEVNLDFAGNYREVFSPADQRWTDLGNLFAATLQANISGDTELIDALCVPRQVTHAHDNRTGQTTVSAIFDVEAPIELAGRTITPPSVPSEDPDDGTWDFPEGPKWPAEDVALLANLLAFDLAEGCWLRTAGATDWVERNGTRSGTDDDDYQGGWDPWWFTPAKHNTTDVNASILWATQVGKIWRSVDGGQTWVDMSPNIDEPPNYWGDVPAPTLAGLTFIQRTDNIHRNKEHYFLAEWQEVGGDWRGWILKTDDDGALGSWSWVTLFGKSGNECAPSPPPCFDPVNCAPGVCGSGDLTPDGMWRTLTSVQAIDLCPDDALPAHRIVFYMDCIRYISTRNAAGMAACGVDLLRGYTCDGGLIITTNVTTQTDMQIDRLALVSTDPFTIEVNIGDTPILSGEVRPIWMDVDSESGDYIYMTAWDGTDLRLYIYTTDLEYDTDFDLGPATDVEIAAKTYVAYPYTPPFNQDIIYVFGRMNAPVGLVGVQHLIRTINGGGAWASVENGWGADYCSAFRAEGSTDGARQFYAARCGAGVAQFYQGLESLVLRGNTSFGAGVWVYVDALTVNSTGQIAIGGDTAAATMITISDDNGATWTDITDSFPATGSVSSLTYV